MGNIHTVGPNEALIVSGMCGMFMLHRDNTKRHCENIKNRYCRVRTREKTHANHMQSNLICPSLSFPMNLKDIRNMTTKDQSKFPCWSF